MAKKVSTTTSAPKVKRTKGKALSMPQRFAVMKLVTESAASTYDADIASQASTMVGRPVAVGTIRSYRKQFGVATVAKPKAGQLLAYVEMLKRQIVTLGGVPFDMPQAPVAASTAIPPAASATINTSAPLSNVGEPATA